MPKIDSYQDLDVWQRGRQEGEKKAPSSRAGLKTRVRRKGTLTASSRLETRGAIRRRMDSQASIDAYAFIRMFPSFLTPHTL